MRGLVDVVIDHGNEQTNEAVQRRFDRPLFGRGNRAEQGLRSTEHRGERVLYVVEAFDFEAVERTHHSIGIGAERRLRTHRSAT